MYTIYKCKNYLNKKCYNKYREIMFYTHTHTHTHKLCDIFYIININLNISMRYHV